MRWWRYRKKEKERKKGKGKDKEGREVRRGGGQRRGMEGKEKFKKNLWRRRKGEVRSG